MSKLTYLKEVSISFASAFGTDQIAWNNGYWRNIKQGTQLYKLIDQLYALLWTKDGRKQASGPLYR